METPESKLEPDKFTETLNKLTTSGQISTEEKNILDNYMLELSRAALAFGLNPNNSDKTMDFGKDLKSYADNKVPTGWELIKKVLEKIN